MTKWKKPNKPNETFQDVIKLIGVHRYNTTHYAVFGGLLNTTKYHMKLAEFNKIIKANKFDSNNNTIKGTFFLNPQGLIRLYN